jgi:hypothetical protein
MHGAAHDNEAAFRHQGAKAFVRCGFLCVNPNHQHSAGLRKSISQSIVCSSA